MDSFSERPMEPTVRHVCHWSGFCLQPRYRSVARIETVPAGTEAGRVRRWRCGTPCRASIHVPHLPLRPLQRTAAPRPAVVGWLLGHCYFPGNDRSSSNNPLPHSATLFETTKRILTTLLRTTTRFGAETRRPFPPGPSHAVGGLFCCRQS